MRTSTIYDVAEKADVSPRTVGRYFKAPEKLAKKTFEKIRHTVEALDYRPNVYANRVSCGKQDVLAVMAYLKEGYVLDERHLTLLGYISDQLCKHGKDMLMIMVNSENQETVIKESLRKIKFDSLLLLNQPSNKIIDELKRCPFPKVSINWRIQIALPNYRAVGIDHYNATQGILEYLMKKGYRHFAYVGPHFSENEMSVYGKAAFDIVEKHGKGYSIGFIRYHHDGGTPVERGRIVLEHALTMNPKPRLLFCHNDYIAIAISNAAREMGLDIPTDFALAGSDEGSFNGFNYPVLTTVRHPWEKMTGKAVNLLIDESEWSNGDSKYINFKYEIVEGGST